MRWMVALIWRLPPRSRRWRLVLPELTGIGATPAARASLASAGEAAGAGDLADELGRGQRPEAGLGEQLRRDLGDQAGDLALERLDGLRELADAAQLVAGDADAHRLLGPREPTRDPRRPGAVEQRAAGQSQLGPEVVQMPLQRVVERHALADQSLAMIDEQPQVELGALQLRRRQRVQALAQRRSRDRHRVDAVGLAALTSAAPRASHQLRRHPQDPLAAVDQKPLERPRDMPTILDRPDPLAAEPARPAQPALRSLGRRPGPSARPPTRPSSLRPLRSCASACERPPPARSSPRSPPPRLGGSPADTACCGRCHAPIKSRRNIPDRRRATQRKLVKPQRADSLKQSQLAAGRRTIPAASDITDTARSITTASLKPTVRLAAARVLLIWCSVLGVNLSE